MIGGSQTDSLFDLIAHFNNHIIRPSPCLWFSRSLEVYHGSVMGVDGWWWQQLGGGGGGGAWMVLLD